MPRILPPERAKPTRSEQDGRGRRAVARVAVVAAAGALLLSGCDAGGAVNDLAEEFGNARQVSEEPDTTAGAPDPASADGDTSASPSASPAPEVLPSFDARSVVGDLAPGFPKGVVSVPEGAKLLASSAATVPDTKPATVQVTLNLSAKRPPAKLLEQVSSVLAKNGFEKLEAPAESGMSEQAAFTRTTTVKQATVNESLLVGVLKDGDRALLTLSGTVAAKPGA